MCAASLVATVSTAPVPKAAAGPRIQLETAVPLDFGEWRIDPTSAALVVNPQTQEVLDRLYGQVLTRTYVNGRGYRIMLSLAYGSDQRGSLQAHQPEVCYVAQGFTLLNNEPVDIQTAQGVISGRRINTRLGARHEPVTYWFAMGDQVVRTRLQRRWAEITQGLTGEIPDGLLFRVSSIDTDTARAYALHDRFVNDLLAASSADDRMRLSGLNATR